MDETPRPVGVMRKESKVDTTQEMLAIAGLSPARKAGKRSLALLCILLGASILGLAAFLAITHLQGSIDTQGPDSATEAVGTAGFDPDKPLSRKEARRIRGIFDEDARRAGKRRRGASRAGDKEIMDFYRADEKDEVAPLGPARMKGAAAASDLAMETSGIIDPDTGGKKQQAVPTDPDGEVRVRPLSTTQISKVVQKHRKRIHQNLDRLLAENPSLSGKLVMVVELKPDGRVAKVHTDNSDFHGTAVEEFLVGAIKRWRFPSFEGPAFRVKIPFLLSARKGG